MSFRRGGGLLPQHTQPVAVEARDRRDSDIKPITTCLWFDTDGEEAATLYPSVFPNSRITSVVPYPEGSMRPAGATMVVVFELNGQPYVALNGGPQFPFTEAVSLQIHCASQEEVDECWQGLLAADAQDRPGQDRGGCRRGPGLTLSAPARGAPPACGR